MKRKGILALGAVVAVCAIFILIVSLPKDGKNGEPGPTVTAPAESPTQETGKVKATPEPSQEPVENEIYYKVAQGQVTPYLTDPDSAVYPDDPSTWEVQIEGELVQVSGTVEAKNSSGEAVKSSFLVQLTDGIRTYIEIDGQAEGERKTVGLQTPTPEESTAPIGEHQVIK